MTPRERTQNIFNHVGSNTAAWIGHPNKDFIPLCAAAWGTAPNEEALSLAVDNDCRWVMADSGYHHPEGRPMFDPSYGIHRSRNLGSAGCFAEAESIADIEKYPWPNPDYLDFSDVYARIEGYADKMVFTGIWCCYYHNLCDFFGMENYFIRMYETPEIVEAATEKIVDFYVEASERFFAGLGDRADVMFFGNDFGTQRALMVSPENFRRFILPAAKRLIAVGKKYNKKIMLHSCGSIAAIIPDLIDAGVDVLHPIQAAAAGMSAAELAQYKNDLAFVGGIDAQTFFVNSTPAQIRNEVLRVRSILGGSIVISPSHEEILPNVPPENLRAMMDAARE